MKASDKRDCDVAMKLLKKLHSDSMNCMKRLSTIASNRGGSVYDFSGGRQAPPRLRYSGWIKMHQF